MSTATRRVALVVWCGLLVLPVAFLGVVLGVVEAEPRQRELRGLFFSLAVAASALDLALARFLAPRVGSATSSPEAVAFTRLLVAWALCEAAVLFPLVAYVVTADARLLGIFAVDLVALALLFPSDERFARLTPRRADVPGPGRMVR